MNPCSLRFQCFGIACPIAFGLIACHDSKAIASPPTPQIYWADTGHKIRRASLDGSNVATVIADAMGNMGDFVIDRRTDHIYWNTGFFIHRSNLDGTGITTLFDFPGGSFRGDITIDPIRNHLFFSDARNHIIYRSGLDGSNAVEIVPTSGTPINDNGKGDLWLDPFAEELYWNFDNNLLHRANLDGSQEQVLFTATAGISDFEIDREHGTVYWTARGGPNGGSVRRANLDGSDQEVLVSGLWYSNGLALDLDRGTMYFTDGSAGISNYDSTIRMANLDGSAARTIINLGPSVVNLPFEITMDSMIVPEPATTLTWAIMAVYLGRLRKRQWTQRDR